MRRSARYLSTHVLTYSLTHLLSYRAQVKWTHLSKEDTTAKNDMGKAEAMWGGDAKLAKKYESRMAGTKAANDFARPAGKRRK